MRDDFLKIRLSFTAVNPVVLAVSRALRAFPSAKVVTWNSVQLLTKEW